MSVIPGANSRARDPHIGLNNRKARRWWPQPALLIFALAALAMAGPAMSASQQLPSPQHPLSKLIPDDAATREGFDHFYNLDYAPAISDFEKSLSDHPNSPYAVNHLLEGILFQELHREGKLDAELYLSNEFVHAKKDQAPTPQTTARIQQLINQALGLEAKELSANPKDVSALYARSVTLGLRAVEEGLLEKAWFTALHSGLEAYDDAKEALAIDPAETDPRLIVGIYNYVVGSLPWPMKIAAFLASIHGSKSKGLALIRQAADGGGEASIDARTTLGLFLARDHQYQESLKLTEWLHAAFPRNFLFGLSVADLLKADGKPSEAIAAYRKLIELGKQGWFPSDDVGLAAMELGNLLRSKRDWPSAAEAYESVGSLPNRDQDLWLQAELAAGQMYDLSGRRQLAVKNYQQVANGSDDPKLTEKARRFLKHPYKGD